MYCTILEGLLVSILTLQTTDTVYYPPSERFNTILVFYPIPCQDFSSVLFLLFHEIGHYLQFHEYRQHDQEQRFWELVNTVDGPQKIRFEQESWDKGISLLKIFLEQYKLSANLLTHYQAYAEQCINTYRIPPA